MPINSIKLSIAQQMENEKKKYESLQSLELPAEKWLIAGREYRCKMSELNAKSTAQK